MRARGHEFGHIIGGRCFASEIGGQAALRVIIERAVPERLACGFLVIEQSPAAAVERPDRGDPWRRGADLSAKVFEHRRRHDLHGVQRPAGHLQKAELEGEGHAVHRRASPGYRRRFTRRRGEEVFDLKR